MHPCSWPQNDRFLFLFQLQNAQKQFYQLTHKWDHPGTGETDENMECVSLCHVRMVILRHVARWFVMLRDGDWNPVHSNVFVSDYLDPTYCTLPPRHDSSQFLLPSCHVPSRCVYERHSPPEHLPFRILSGGGEWGTRRQHRNGYAKIIGKTKK
jgi:hypothetical protein